LSDGKYEVYWESQGVETSDQFDTVIAAVGRYADSELLGLNDLGVETAKNGKVICSNRNEQTNVDNVYAIGDVVQGVPELTPVTIQSGVLLANRLFSEDTEMFDYDMIPTTVFTPIEYGCIGLSEEDAVERFGADLEIFHKEVAPLEWAMVDGKPGGMARLKLICVKSENLRVVGLHILCPNAGEVTQGFAIAMRLGATYSDIVKTIGIHPTVAEAFTTVKVTKSSGEDASAGNC